MGLVGPTARNLKISGRHHVYRGLELQEITEISDLADDSPYRRDGSSFSDSWIDGVTGL